ncbi:MAG: hypothetical protein F4Y17_05200, partial [Gemmatimonadetes bacterium]|nr:hypothetical protein [Gemmatimonadota bacterium]
MTPQSINMTPIRYLGLQLLVCAVLWCDRAAAQEPPFALENFYKGVSWVGGRWEMPENALPEARELGVEWLALTPFGWMEN